MRRVTCPVWLACLTMGIGVSTAMAQPEDVDERLDDLEQRLESVEGAPGGEGAGSTKFVASGYARSSYTSYDNNESSFDAAFFPIFLWELNDQILFAGELEVELDESSSAATGSSDGTEVKLEFLDMSYIVNDFLTLRTGKFLTPLSTFKEQLHPSWINKLPDQPLFATGGARLIPTSSLGFEARGAVGFENNMVLTYAAYVSNGPRLVTTGSSTGQLNFSNFSDINEGKAFGGRLGFRPISDLEITYSFNFADVGADGTAFEDTNATIHAVSAAYISEFDAISGRIDARAEWVLSNVDDVDYGAGTFDNERSGGYVQVAYRPTLTEGFTKDLEGVVRYDWIDNPSDATGSAKAYDEDRFTFGVNYWLSHNAVIKAAYRIDNVDDPANVKEAVDAFMLQVAFGF